MSDGSTLFEAVRRSPEDMTLRLIYADWCEEQGDQPRADFIRLQLEPDGGSEYCTNLLLYRHRLRWDGELLRMLNAGPLRGLVRARRGPVHRWSYRRGFVERLTVQARTFIDHGDELLRLGPLREARLVGPVPWGELLGCPALASLTGLVVQAPGTSLPVPAEVLQGLGHLRTLALELTSLSPWSLTGRYRDSYLARFLQLPPSGVEVVASTKSGGTLRPSRVAGRPGGLRVILATHRVDTLTTA